MDADEIREMEAGREMDALVAEKVMDLAVYWNEKIGGPFTATGDVIIDEEGDELGRLEPMPGYSTDIAAAWQVVEKMLDNGIGLPAIFHDGQLWVTSISDCRPNLNIIASALSAPLAICRAALLAMMSEANGH